MNDLEKYYIPGWTLKAYEAFMWNPDNEYRCQECPENRGETRHLPCGQQKCWVTAHTDYRREAEEAC